MTEDEILAEFRAADALLEGHFILSSGLRIPRYPAMRARADGPGARRAAGRGAGGAIPADRARADRCGRLAGDGRGDRRPRNGARAGVEAMFLERPDGVFELRRGFRLAAGAAAC